MLCVQINANFSNDIIQAATRVNYASNLACIHGLEAMVRMLCHAYDLQLTITRCPWRLTVLCLS